MAYKDLQEYLQALENRGKLRHVKKEVDKDKELACIIRWMYQSVPEKDRYGMMFDKIKGYNSAVVTGVFGANREVYALAIETTPDNIYQKWSNALVNPIKPRKVNSGPVKEVILKGKKVNLTKLPAPVWTPGRDPGPYLSAPLCISKDPDTGIQNVGTYRVQLTTKNKAGIMFFPSQHMGIHYHNKYETKNEAMSVAVVVGTDPSVGLTSVAKIPYGVDEFDIAGGLRQKPLDIVKCETVDLYVPAYAEYVIEGYIPPFKRMKEGPFGEYTGFMGTEDDRPYIEVTCITHREKPIMQGFTSQLPPSESSMIRGMSYNSNLWKRLVIDLKEPGIKDLFFTESSGSWGHVIIQMKTLYPGHSKKVGILASHLLDATTGKIVTVVDDDVDIRDSFSVDWALAFRVDPARDITILERTAAPNLDPSTMDPAFGTDVTPFERRLIGSKMIIDATIKTSYPELSLPYKEYMMDVYERWNEFGLPPIQLQKKTALLLDKHPTGGIIVPYK